jgi:hypothetical protein
MLSGCRYTSYTEGSFFRKNEFYFSTLLKINILRYEFYAPSR